MSKSTPDPGSVVGAVNAEVVEVTPELAELWLVHNHANRHLRWNTINRYADDMANGDWQVGGSTIDFDIDGNLVNGQHRLQACIKARCSFTTIVVRGIPRSSQITMDVGLKRQLNDVLTWRGEVNSTRLAALIALDWRWHMGRLTTGGGHPSFSESLAWLDVNPSARLAATKAMTMKELFCPQSAMGVFIHRIRLIDFDEAEGFLERVRMGENLTSGDPELALRSWLFGQVGHHRAQTKPTTVVYLAVLVKTWNAWITGKSIVQAGWRRGGLLKEDFPSLLDGDGKRIAVLSENEMLER